MIQVKPTGQTLNSVLQAVSFSSSKDDKALEGKIVYDETGKNLGRMTASQTWNYLETNGYIRIGEL